MKHPFRFSLVLALILIAGSVFAQKTYNYESVPGDPMNTRIYTLENGLRVYLTVYKDSPRIQTAIAVRTGSKNDPADNTGMSHYLEHMMFKGTTHFGTSNYQAEAPYLQQIEDLFETYRQTADTLKRTALYHRIDSISGVAAGYAIANEYDKLSSVIGAKGTNAFTGNEQTVYINDIPSNEVENWLKIESDRFLHPVFRIFHTELETVYEEKNMSLDSDDDKLWEGLYASLFLKHPYGTQTTIGTIEHLKNPSLKSLREYYRDRYVPNNMAIVMSGDFDPDKAIALVDRYFGMMEAKPVKPFVSPAEDPIAKPVVKEVFGPNAENVAVAFRLGGIHTPDADLANMLSEVLSNGKAGLIDLNLNLGQKVLEANAGADVQADYTTFVLTGRPKEGQTLEEVKDLLLSQVELVKKGEFPEWLLPAIISNMKLSKIRQQENNTSRALGIASTFITGQPYKEYVNEIENLSKITKTEIVDFANKNFGENYVVVYKRIGEDKNVKKVTKPAITPVVMNRDNESEFLKEIMASKVEDIAPVFIDYKKDLSQFRTPKGLNVLYVPNTENGTFLLSYYFAMGSQNDLKLATAANYLSYLGTSKYSADQLKEEFYKLACNYSVSVNNDEINIGLSGLTENMGKAMALMENLLADAQPNQEALDNLVRDILKERADKKLNKNVIRQALTAYGAYGPRSPFTNILGEPELKALSGAELTGLIHGLSDYRHEVLYYGPMQQAELASLIDKLHKVPAQFREVPARVKYPQLETGETRVYAVDYNMKQVDIVLHSTSIPFDAGMIPVMRMFNEYFGSGMNSIVFQEIREAKALAYSSSAAYRTPAYPDEKNTIFGFVGTQNDKLPEAMKAMFALFNNMPESEKSFAAAREGILNQISTERITRQRILYNYLNARRFGYDHDIRRDVFEQVPAMKFDDIRAFQQEYLKDKKFTILIVGNLNKIDRPVLESYGNVTNLTLEEIFGY
ncbi:MAG TPA: insulinase family protein [Bacteroidales bacterium]|nr:insulinase family protein [Bacteroidales bacterium]